MGTLKGERDMPLLRFLYLGKPHAPGVVLLGHVAALVGAALPHRKIHMQSGMIVAPRGNAYVLAPRRQESKTPQPNQR